jgi:hypothetical protein
MCRRWPRSYAYAIASEAARDQAVAVAAGLNSVRVDAASAATLDLTGTAPNGYDFRVTGTTTITAVNLAAGRTARLVFSGSLTLTNGANLTTQTGANIVTQAGDTCLLRATAANVVEVLSYVPAALNTQSTRSRVRVHTSNGYGSVANKIRRFTTVVENQGSDITYADSATQGATFTINKAGVYGISYSEVGSVAAHFGVTLNETQTTLFTTNVNAADRLCAAVCPSADWLGHTGVTAYLPAGSVIRPHTDAPGASANASAVQFTITRVA